MEGRRRRRRMWMREQAGGGGGGGGGGRRKEVAGEDLTGSECDVDLSERVREVVQPVSFETSFQY
eukprot:4882797-Pyramimonas_sp.AAC.1